jgi:Ca2+-binding EF-hand superfamily protein
MTTKGMSWKFRDQDGSGNIDPREFQESLREYDKAPHQLNQETGFVVPRAGVNHYFYEPIYDPYGESRAEQHYEQLQQQWGQADKLKAGDSKEVHLGGAITIKDRFPGRSSPSRSSSRRSGGSSRSPSHGRRSSGGMAVDAGRTPWHPKLLDPVAMRQERGEGLNYDPAKLGKTNMRLRENHRDQPHYHTTGELVAHRAEEMKPSRTFDVDGDGVVSAQDFFLASKFDVNGDKVLDEGEVKQLRKQMVKTVLETYKKVPRASTKETDEMLREFQGENLNKLVSSQHFLKKFEKLYQKTAVSMTWDSKFTGGCLKPFDQPGQEGVARSLVGTKAGKQFRTLAERTSNPASLGVDLDTSRSNDTLNLTRNTEWIKGGERQKWSGFASRESLMRSRRAETKKMCESRVDR